ncbi:SsgA family sporulation/cell division regulator [Streptomyces sp. KK5PA1]|uniref:SsgA family sporulation/cell division regulator n=1 Tax=Actinacidiphila acididurans TaxID=2784346 RepID=A0ABS2TSH7_9ACTN|nr:SsgA family sporulation/cell division regulator [Actinacidiphila acididurans]
MLLSYADDLRFPVWLAYHPQDCFAVRLTLGPAGEEGATWVFSWELLAAGLTRPTGEGDVQVAPAPAGGWVLLALGCRTDEPARLRLSRTDVERFVAEAGRRSRYDRLAAVPDALEGELDRILDCA